MNFTNLFIPEVLVSDLLNKALEIAERFQFETHRGIMQILPADKQDFDFTDLRGLIERAVAYGEWRLRLDIAESLRAIGLSKVTKPAVIRGLSVRRRSYQHLRNFHEDLGLEQLIPDGVYAASLVEARQLVIRAVAFGYWRSSIKITESLITKERVV